MKPHVINSSEVIDAKVPPSGRTLERSREKWASTLYSLIATLAGVRKIPVMPDAFAGSNQDLHEAELTAEIAESPSIDLYMQRIAFYLDQKKWQQAQDDLEIVEQMDICDTDITYFKGAYAKGIGKYHQAILYLRHYLHTDIRNSQTRLFIPGVRLVLAELYQRDEQYAEAIKEYRKVLESVVNLSPTIYLKVVQTLERTSEPGWQPLALEILEHAGETSAANSKLRAKLAEIELAYRSANAPQQERRQQHH